MSRLLPRLLRLTRLSAGGWRRAPRDRAPPRTRWIACCLALCCAVVAAQCRAAEAPPAEPCPPLAAAPTAEQIQAYLRDARDRGFLWRLDKDGRSSWLYGTIHVAKLDWAFVGPTLMAAVRASDEIALELDLLDPAIQQAIQRENTAQALRPLPKRLEQRLLAQLRASCLPEQLLTSMTPELLAATLVLMSARVDGLDPSYAIDLAYASIGRALGKPVRSLETPALQMRLLRGRNARETQVLVDQSLADLEAHRARTLLLRLTATWADGRLDELERYEDWCECVNDPIERALYQRLLDERNPGLAEGIDALHATGRQVFVAVGSLHMVGPTGLPRLLAARGYTVERVVLPR